jgi:hypothetical protein
MIKSATQCRTPNPACGARGLADRLARWAKTLEAACWGWPSPEVGPTGSEKGGMTGGPESGKEKKKKKID